MRYGVGPEGSEAYDRMRHSKPVLPVTTPPSRHVLSISVLGKIVLQILINKCIFYEEINWDCFTLLNSKDLSQGTGKEALIFSQSDQFRGFSRQRLHPSPWPIKWLQTFLSDLIIDIIYIYKDKSSCLITVFEILVQYCFIKDSSANTLLF